MPMKYQNTLMKAFIWSVALVGAHAPVAFAPAALASQASLLAQAEDQAPQNPSPEILIEPVPP